MTALVLSGASFASAEEPATGTTDAVVAEASVAPEPAPPVEEPAVEEPPAAVEEPAVVDPAPAAEQPAGPPAEPPAEVAPPASAEENAADAAGPAEAPDDADAVDEVMALAAADDNDQVCADLHTGHETTVGKQTSWEITAPPGMLIYGYCVKAGSIEQGEGPVYVVLNPPVTSVTISHPSGKEISHYSVAYVAECPDAEPETATNAVIVTQAEFEAIIGDPPQCAEPIRDVAIEKTHSTIPDGAVEYGQVFSYTLTVTNVGTQAFTDGVVSDTVPDSLTVLGVTVPLGWLDESSGNQVTVSGVALAPGASAEIVVQVQVEPAPEPGPIGEFEGDIVNTACVDVPGDIFPGNDCDTDTVPRDELLVDVFVECVADAPYLHYAVQTSGSLAGMPITMTWAPTTGPADPAEVQRVLASGDSGSIVWPGAAFAGNGNSIEWPGYRLLTEADYNPDGTLAVDPSLVYNGRVLDTSYPTYPWRLDSTVTFEVNPTVVVEVTYPPQTENCAMPRSAAMLIEKTASKTSVAPGEGFDYTLVGSNISVDSVADPVVITDVIPASLRVDSVTTDGAAFPRWQDCAVTGTDAAGFGGTLECTLFGPLMMGETAPAIVLSVTTAADVAAGTIDNTAEICWGSADSGGELVGCDDDTVSVTVMRPAPGSVTPLAATGSEMPLAPMFAGVAALMLGAGLLLLQRRRRAGIPTD
ncbi:DUF11 domain-containing protein [Microbacterium cremeum]|uniref:DUF11 domain-containing protein n=1 Tax=Microbacterium cremeum TaxID=2782169 RepID=UPI0018872512|nr:DUF11 domain-containing protein [Microbacterium cremeum]